MTFKAQRPEDMLSDTENFFEREGKKIRKGTMAAAVTNADIFESEAATEAEKAEAIKILKELAPTLNAFGLNKHFYWRNKALQAIFDDAEKQ